MIVHIFSLPMMWIRYLILLVVTAEVIEDAAEMHGQTYRANLAATAILALLVSVK